MTINAKQIICALDFDNFSKAESFIKAIEYDIVYKVGMEFFFRFGIDGIRKICNTKKNIKLFLDLKLHDIPNTVERAIYPLITSVRPYMLTLHVAGGKKMLENAVSAATKASKNINLQKPLLLGVTVLTSLNNKDLEEMGHINSITKSVENYSSIAKKAKLDGIVCSPLEVKLIKNMYGNSLKIITPGIRLEKSSNDDQLRFLSPKEAFNSGSDYIVMGRPLINASDPNKVIQKIINN
jgi:orotidine-5'-phosphate decarboxylase